MKNVSVTKFIRLCMMLTKWYFEDGNKGLDRRARSKNPFSFYKMKILVNRALYNGDISIGNVGRELSKFQPKRKS